MMAKKLTLESVKEFALKTLDKEFVRARKDIQKAKTVESLYDAFEWYAATGGDGVMDKLDALQEQEENA